MCYHTLELLILAAVLLLNHYYIAYLVLTNGKGLFDSKIWLSFFQIFVKELISSIYTSNSLEWRETPLSRTTKSYKFGNILCRRAPLLPKLNLFSTDLGFINFFVDLFTFPVSKQWYNGWKEIEVSDWNFTKTCPVFPRSCQANQDPLLWKNKRCCIFRSFWYCWAIVFQTLRKNVTLKTVHLIACFLPKLC